MFSFYLLLSFRVLEQKIGRTVHDGTGREIVWWLQLNCIFCNYYKRYWERTKEFLDGWLFSFSNLMAFFAISPGLSKQEVWSRLLATLILKHTAYFIGNYLCSKVPINKIQTENSDKSGRAFSSVSPLKDDLKGQGVWKVHHKIHKTEDFYFPLWLASTSTFHYYSLFEIFDDLSVLSSLVWSGWGSVKKKNKRCLTFTCLLQKPRMAMLEISYTFFYYVVCCNRLSI